MGCPLAVRLPTGRLRSTEAGARGELIDDVDEKRREKASPCSRLLATLSISSGDRTEKKMVCGTMPRSWRLAVEEDGVRASGESKPREGMLRDSSSQESRGKNER